MCLSYFCVSVPSSGHLHTHIHYTFYILRIHKLARGEGVYSYNLYVRSVFEFLFSSFLDCRKNNFIMIINYACLEKTRMHVDYLLMNAYIILENEEKV